MISRFNLPDDYEIRNASRHKDTEKIIDLCCQTWGEEGRSYVESVILNHPRMKKDDQFMMIDKTTDTLCSCLCRLPDQWNLEGLEIQVDHMEFVNTLPQHRGKGFIHILNAKFNERSEEHDSVIQVISGVPYFYHKLGYEYAADAYGGRTIIKELIPKLPDESNEPVTIEQVGKNKFKEYVDYRRKMFTGLLTRTVDVKDYDYMSFNDMPTRDSIMFYLVMNNNRTVGIFWLRISNDCVEMDDLYLDDVTHLNTVLRFAKDFVFNIGPVPLIVRPAAQVVIDHLLEHTGGSRFQRKQAWYVRIPNLKKLIIQMIPLLNTRLRESIYSHHSGHLKISTYQEALQLSIEQGNIVSIDTLDISISREWGCDLYLPPQTVPRLMMGYMTLSELENYHNDVIIRSNLRNLINVIFPKVRARALWSP